MAKETDKQEARGSLFSAFVEEDSAESSILSSTKIPTFSSAPDLNTLNVPSFSSAPLVGLGSEDDEKNENSSTQRVSVRTDKKQKKHKEERRKHSYSRDSQLLKSRKKKRIEEKPKDKYQERISLLSSNRGMENVFYIDSKGDPQNIFYGGLHKYDIPKFRRYNSGRVIGLAPDLRIDSEKSKIGKEIVLYVKGYGKTTETLRYSDARLRQQTKRIRTAKRKGSDSRLNEDFVPLDETKSKDDDDNVDYRTIEGPAKNPEEDVGQEPSDDEGETFDEYVMRKSKEFDRAIQEDPKNVDVWLQLVAFQDEAIKFSKKSAGKSTIGEIKLAIFEKALDKNPNNEELLLGYLKCCENIMDSARLLNKWDQVLSENGHILSLWVSYLNFRQSNFASYSFSQCLEVYESCIQMLSERLKDVNADILAIERTLLHIFVRACHFLKQSGYVERAYACYQAMVEIHFFCPEQYRQYSFEKQLDQFEEFWECEVPRFGEDGAIGWMNFSNQTSEAIDNALSRFVTNPATQINDIDSWYRSESTENTDESMPLRSVQTDDTDEDPLRVVLFDDIKSLLISLQNDDNRMMLFYSLLQFVGLPVNRDLRSSHPFCLDVFLHAELNHQHIINAFIPSDPLSKNTMSIVNIDGVYMEAERSTFNDPFKYPIKNSPQAADSIFSAQKWFKVFHSEDVAHVNIPLCRNMFQQIKSRVEDSCLSLIYLFLESQLDITSARKIAKNMLKTDRMNLLLWNGYAQMEYKRQGFEEAQKIYATAFSMYRTFPIEYQKAAPLLYRSFAEMTLDHGNTEGALVALVHYTNGAAEFSEPLSATKILKARKWYQEKLHEIAKFNQREFTDHYVLDIKVCYILFEYLSQGFDEAQKVMTQYVTQLQNEDNEKSIQCEHLYASFVQLIYRNIQLKRAYQPRVLRDILESALKLFPHNTIFLSMYLYNESRTKIENRLRRFLENALQKEPSHVLWTFYLYAELHHHQPYNIHMVRSLLEQALDSTSAQNSVSIWTLYIQLEVRQGDLSKGKVLFYRAIRECPWSKDLYLLAFSILRQAFDGLELQQIGNLLLEKEMRVRSSVEALIEPLISGMNEVQPIAKVTDDI